MIVVDTNVVSELMRAHPEPLVLAWVSRTAVSDLVTTAITVAEIDHGLARLPDGRRSAALRRAATDVFDRFADAVLPFDAAAARAYASLVTARERQGRPISVFDAQIAAIAVTHGASLATRNVSDFRDMGLRLVDPWFRPPQD